MRSFYYLLIAGLVLPLAAVKGQLLPNFGGERAGLSTLSFLKNDLSPRSMGLSGASVALDGDAYSILNNPASLTDLEHQNYTLSHLMLGAGVQQSFIAAHFPLDNKVSTLSFSLNGLNSGKMKERTEFMPGGTGRSVSVTNLAVGATYARQLSTMFSAGVTLKYIYEGIAGYGNSTATVDLSFLYRTDFKDLQFAVMVQNFGGNSALSSNNDVPVVFNRQLGIGLDDNTVPTIFKLGLSLTPYEKGNHAVNTMLQLNHPNDNAENYRLGVEYQYLELLWVRAGYQLNVRHRNYPSFGFGLRTQLGSHPLYIDYAAAPTDFMGLQHNVGLRFTLMNDQR